MSTLTLAQFEQLLATNVLTDPPLFVRNKTYPRGQVSFNVLGSDFRMRNVIVPVSGSAVDLTLYAPLRNLLASSELREVIESGHLIITNPEDIPDPVDPIDTFPEGSVTIDQPVYTDATAITGKAPTGTQVQTILAGSIAAAIAENNRFSVNVSALEVGNLNVTFLKEGFKTVTQTVAVSVRPDVPYPQPTVADYTYFDSAISGTTLPNATVDLNKDGVLVESVDADSEGKFSVAVPNPPGTLELVFSAAGYTQTTVTVLPKEREANVTVNTPDYLDEEIVLNMSDVQPVDVQVEIEIDGQSLITDLFPNNTQEFAVVCGAIKGDVKVTVKSTGFKETSFTRTPTKNTFGAVVVNEVHAEETSVSGSVAGSRNADDAKVELVTIEKTYSGNVGTDGTFNIPTDSLNVGDASVHFTSAFFDPKTQDFDILAKEIPAPTFNAVYKGESEISGTTLEGVKVSYGAHETVTPTGGAFTLTTDPLEAGDIVLQFSKTNYATKDVTVSVAPLMVQAEPTAQTVYVGETEINGTAEPDAEIFIASDKVGDVESDGSFSLSGPSLNAEETLTFKKARYNDETLVVAPVALSNFTQPSITVTEDATEISGTTEADTLVTSADATDSEIADLSGAFTLVLKVPAVAGSTIEIGLSRRGFITTSFEYTVEAKTPTDPA